VNFFVGVSCGITTYTARHFGKQDMRAVQQTIYNGSMLFLLLGTILSVIAFFSAPFLLNVMGTPAESFAYANIYLRTSMCGLVFCVMFNTFSGILRAMGDTKLPLYSLIFCSFINIGLDLMFVIIFQWGVFGVAFATILAQAISTVILGIVIYKKSPEIKHAFSLDKNMMLDICKVGLPAGVQSIMYSLSNILVQKTINDFGYLAVSAWAAYVKIDNIIDVFVSSLASSVIPFVGQNLGAGKFERVKQSVKQIMFICYVIAAVLTLSFILFRLPLIGIPHQIFSQALRGFGKSFSPMIITLIGVVGLRVIWVIYIFQLRPTIYFLGLCYPISSLIMSVTFTVYYLTVIKAYGRNLIDNVMEKLKQPQCSTL